MPNAGYCYDVPGDNRPAYSSANISLSNLWWYQACDSHGCGGGCEQILPSDKGYSSCHMGWPSYMVRTCSAGPRRRVASWP